MYKKKHLNGISILIFSAILHIFRKFFLVVIKIGKNNTFLLTFTNIKIHSIHIVHANAHQRNKNKVNNI